MSSPIDWSQVPDGLGTAELVPGLVTMLGSKKKAERERAFVVLADERLVHQGQVWPAAPLAVPLLVEALGQEKHPGRARVLDTLACIAVGVPSAYACGAAMPSLAELEAHEGVSGDA